MFTNVPIEKFIGIMYEILEKYGVDLENLAHTSLDRNICQFDGPGEVPMGGPTSSIIAEVFMDRLERWALNRYRGYGIATSMT